MPMHQMAVSTAAPPKRSAPQKKILRDSRKDIILPRLTTWFSVWWRRGPAPQAFSLKRCVSSVPSGRHCDTRSQAGSVSHPHQYRILMVFVMERQNGCYRGSDPKRKCWSASGRDRALCAFSFHRLEAGPEILTTSTLSLGSGAVPLTLFQGQINETLHKSWKIKATGHGLTGDKTCFRHTWQGIYLKPVELSGRI